jgi:hypothetical protein
MERTGFSTRRISRATLAVAVAALAAAAALGINLPAAVRAVSGPPGAAKPAAAVCLSTEQARWVCGAIPTDPPRSSLW